MRDIERKVSVDYASLREVLVALLGPPHLIRELQAIVSLPDNPISRLVGSFNAAVKQEASSDE